jgi:hypothetical protein
MKNIKIIIFGIIIILLSQFSSYSQVKIPLRKYEKWNFTILLQHGMRHATIVP